MFTITEEDKDSIKKVAFAWVLYKLFIDRTDTSGALGP